jgi:hypothetical protein
MDGLRIVYTKMGKPLLEEGEELVAERPTTSFAVYAGSKTKGDPIMHHAQGDTVLHLTDRRMLVLIDPSLSEARDVLRLPGEESYIKGKELFEVIQGRGRYYIIVHWSEIPRMKVPSKSKKTALIQVRPERGQVHTILVDRESALWIERVWNASH